MASAAALFTAVIGAGPAGLLFCFVSSQLRLSSDQWQLALFDKRETYERAHRLRIDPDPYKAIQADLASPAFDAFMGFLAEEEYRPAANQLETYLAAALARQRIVHLPGSRAEAHRRSCVSRADRLALASQRL